MATRTVRARKQEGGTWVEFHPALRLSPEDYLKLVRNPAYAHLYAVYDRIEEFIDGRWQGMLQRDVLGRWELTSRWEEEEALWP